jgi:SAM-dependent methyltransferase
MRTTLLRKFVRFQARLCEAFDTLLPPEFLVDGNMHFQREFAPGFIKNGMLVYDMGGGKNPLISRTCKVERNLRVYGVDIDLKELSSAPEGTYDGVICADIAQYQGNADAELVICQSLLEHVKDIEGAFAGISSTLKGGGIALLFVPSRNAAYARLNLLIPQWLKRWLLFTIFPERRRDQGFPAYYRRCTPKDFRRLAGRFGLKVLEVKPYFMSSYFSFLFPLYVAWRLWVLFFRYVRGEQAAETFSMALMKV